MSRVLRTLAVICVGGLAAGVSPALGAFPGENGRIAFMSDRTGDGEEIFDMSSDGSQQRNLTNSPADDFHESYSPDGGRIVFSTFRDDGGARDNAELYVMDANGSNQRRITFNGFLDGAPAWSPDGKWLVFARTTASKKAAHDLWILNLESGEERNVTNSPTADDDEPQWSPDGTRIAFHSDAHEAGNRDVYTIRPDGRDLRRLTNAKRSDGEPNYSPDSRQITFTSDRHKQDDIFVMRADGASQTRLTDGPRGEFMSCFSPDGRFIAFSSERDGDRIPGTGFFSDIFRMRADGSQQTKLTTSPANDDFRPDWQPLLRR